MKTFWKIVQFLAILLIIIGVSIFFLAAHSYQTMEAQSQGGGTHMFGDMSGFNGLIVLSGTIVALVFILIGFLLFATSRDKLNIVDNKIKSEQK